MDYPEFNKYQKIDGKEFPLVNAYKDEEGNILVVEPSFYFGLENIRLRREDQIPNFLNKIDELLKANHNLVLTGDFENPFYINDKFIYKELEDVLTAIGLFFEDKSRGSDYGD